MLDFAVTHAAFITKTYANNGVYLSEESSGNIDEDYSIPFSKKPVNFFTHLRRQLLILYHARFLAAPQVIICSNPLTNDHVRRTDFCYLLIKEYAVAIIPEVTQ